MLNRPKDPCFVTAETFSGSADVAKQLLWLDLKQPVILLILDQF